MKNTPFIYGSTVSNFAFTNREDESEKLRANLVNGINTMIISPRRWGKSSLVEKVIADINTKERKIKTVVIDLFGVSSEEEFMEIFAREVIKASTSQWQDWLKSGKEFFKSLMPKLSVGLDPVTDFSLAFDWSELKKHGNEALNLPETIAVKKGIKFIICLDEFQNLSAFPGFTEFEKKMRSCWQRHKNVTYCIYGSKRHMLTNIFNNPSKPFYRFGDIILLQKIITEKWVSFICGSFKNTGKLISPADAQKIPHLMKNHPWYVQQLAHYTWSLTQKKATTKEINTALNELINTNTPFYQSEAESITGTQVNLLKAIANKETQLTSTAVMQRYALGTPNNVLKNKNILINKDIIHEINNVFEFLDPSFELWFRKQYLKQNYFIA